MIRWMDVMGDNILWYLDSSRELSTRDRPNPDTLKRGMWG